MSDIFSEVIIPALGLLALALAGFVVILALVVLIVSMLSWVVERLNRMSRV